MSEKLFFKIRLYVTALVIVAAWVVLAWSHYHGGVPSHHLLADKDLPAISNWWGGLLLPVLTWFLLFRIQRRIAHDNAKKTVTSKYLNNILYRAGGSILFGVLLSVFFTFGYSDLSGYLVLTLIPLALFYPIYRAECLLGFVVGMTYTFGAVLPTVIGSLFLLLAALVYLVFRPGILFIASKFKRQPS